MESASCSGLLVFDPCCVFSGCKRGAKLSFRLIRTVTFRIQGIKGEDGTADCPEGLFPLLVPGPKKRRQILSFIARVKRFLGLLGKKEEEAAVPNPDDGVPIDLAGNRQELSLRILNRCRDR
jgi:hypothetical protein